MEVLYDGKQVICSTKEITTTFQQTTMSQHFLPPNTFMTSTCFHYVSAQDHGGTCLGWRDTINFQPQQVLKGSRNIASDESRLWYLPSPD